MKMKKILFSLLAVFMLVVAVACGKKEAPTEDANAQQQGGTQNKYRQQTKQNLFHFHTYFLLTIKVFSFNFF